jgi:hypothetical protein
MFLNPKPDFGNKSGVAGKRVRPPPVLLRKKLTHWAGS